MVNTSNVSLLTDARILQAERARDTLEAVAGEPRHILRELGNLFLLSALTSPPSLPGQQVNAQLLSDGATEVLHVSIRDQITDRSMLGRITALAELELSGATIDTITAAYRFMGSDNPRRSKWFDRTVFSLSHVPEGGIEASFSARSTTLDIEGLLLHTLGFDEPTIAKVA